jgi:hypothetical protein
MSAQIGRAGPALAAAALIVVGAAALPAGAGRPALDTRGPLVDLLPAVDSATDGATAQVVVAEGAGRTTVVLRVRGLHAAAGTTFGAHVHEGSCVAGNGAAALGHYNVSDADPPVVDETTEVWLDFSVNPAGHGTAVAHVPFTIEPGSAGSVVVHEAPTAPDGTAGRRLACLGVPF